MAEAVVLITGATSGIGAALARIYGERGARLVLIGRRDSADLDPTLYGPDRYCRVDLTQADAAQTVVAWLDAQGIDRLDTAILNAGMGYYGDVAAQSPAHIQELIALNLRAPIALSHALLPRLDRAQGKLVFVSSVASALATPAYATYTATKAALDGFARSLRIEQAGRVRVQVVHPGAVNTGMHAKIGIPKESMNWEKFPPAHKVAAQMVRAIQGRRRNPALGMGNQLARWAGIYAPGPLDRLMHKRSAPQTQSSQSLQSPKTCLITGAADGIGKALAGRFAQDSYAITGIDVDLERAGATQNELAQTGANVGFLLADLTQVDEVARVVRELAAGPAFDICIHNAGISAVGPFAASDMARQQAVIDLNFQAPLLLNAGLLAAGRVKPGGSLIFMSSLSKYVSYPGAAVYAASKDGLASYARSLGAGLVGQGIHVLTVFPGPTRTAHARRYSPDNRREQRRMPPETLAEQIFAATQARRTLLIPGLANRAGTLLGLLAPRLMEAIMRKTILEKL